MKAAQLVSVTHAAKILKVSDETLRRWEKLGHIVPERTSGGARRYEIDHLEQIRKAVNGSVKLGRLPETLRKLEDGRSKMDYYLRPYSLNYPKSTSASDDFQASEKPHAELFNNRVPQLAGSGFFRSVNLAKLVAGSAATMAMATLAITGSLVAGYLTNPSATKSFPAASMLSPFDYLAKGYLSMIMPQKAKELGLTGQLPIANSQQSLTLRDKQLATSELNVLAATNKRSGSITFNADTILNADATLKGDISLEGKVIKGLVQTIIAGSNIAIVDGDTPNPTISVTLPTNLVNSFATSATGTKTDSIILVTPEP